MHNGCVLNNKGGLFVKKFSITIKDSVPKKPKVEINITRIAYITGYSKGHISRVFAGKTIPSLACFAKLAGVMGLSFGEIFIAIKGGKIGVTKTRQKSEK